MNDQRNLNWAFISWFSRIGLVFGLMCISGLHATSLYPKYWIVFVLAIIVLFLNTWTNIRRMVRHSLKWMALSALVASVTSVAISTINIVDYKAVNSLYARTNILQRYNIQLPKSAPVETLGTFYNAANIYVPRAQVGSGEPTILARKMADDNKLAFETVTVGSIGELIARWSKEASEYNSSMDYGYTLYIDRDVDMDALVMLKTELSKADVKYIRYAVVPADGGSDIAYFKGILPTYYSNRERWISLEADTPPFKNIIEVELLEGGGIHVNNASVASSSLQSVFKKLLHDGSYLVRLAIRSKSTYHDYIAVFSSVQQAVNELRNELSQQLYSKKFQEIDIREQARTIREKYPLSIFEYTK